MILFGCSIGTLVLTMAILCPVVGSVNQARMKVLSLFVDIPNHHIINLANKCERFMTSLDVDTNEEGDSDDEGSRIDDSDVTSNSTGKRSSQKLPKNSTKSSKKVFIQFGVAVINILAYFGGMFYLSKVYTRNIVSYTKELNVLAQAESYYAFIQNAEREFLYLPNHTVKGVPWEEAKSLLTEIYPLN
mmetsp:Transcript_29899/g.29075  ORF Transcript_29899/g.29075 Transcript_29899/m.29075 type:complete len:188 (+) Transcript_29899:391-954(+)